MRALAVFMFHSEDGCRMFLRNFGNGIRSESNSVELNNPKGSTGTSYSHSASYSDRY